MLPSTPELTSSYLGDDDTLKQKTNWEEELNYSEAIQADKTFEEVKAIRDRINKLKKW